MAVLVDLNEPQWEGTCLRVIEFFTRLWGGIGNIIIPTDGKTIAPLFWRILNNFDPDYLAAYRRTARDLEIEQPAKFGELYQTWIEEWGQQIGGTPGPDNLSMIRDNLRNANLNDFSISRELEGELKSRLAPFYLDEWVVGPGFLSAASIPHHPHTDVVDVLPYVEHSPHVLRISTAAPFSPLWWASSFGAVNSELQAQLARMNISVDARGGEREDDKLLIRLAVKGYEDIETTRFFANSSLNAIHATLMSAPMRLSMAGLGYYRSRRHREWQEPVVAVAGTRLEDFAFYYALSRMRNRVVWIPPTIVQGALDGTPAQKATDPAWHFSNDLASLARGNSQRHGGMKITSVTLSERQLEQVRSQLSERAVSPPEHCQIGMPAEIIPIHPTRHYEDKNISVLRSFFVPDDGMIRLFDTPIPKSLAEVRPENHRWLTELNIAQYRLPRHSALGERVMGSPAFSSNDARISSDGPTYFCPNWFVLGGASAESSVVRPSVRIPEPLEIFRYVSRAGDLSCAVSDKGLYAEGACQKFGGLSTLAEFLRSSSGQSFAAAFLDSNKPREGEHLRGCLVGDRRYLDLDSLADIIGGEDEAARILDRLSSASVLYRGLVLQCEYCRRADWFPLGDLTDSFRCKRCHRAQVFTHRHWRHPSQPQLYYQLDEIVHLGLEHNMQVPLLALDALQRMSSDSFLYVHELGYRELDAKTPPIEVDLNCVADGLLTIGEAKKDNRLGKNDKEESETISKYFDLAKRLAAHQVVFATASEQWHSTTIERIKSAFKSERFHVILFSRNHLYGDQPT
jgi:hypothetical protein